MSTPLTPRTLVATRADKKCGNSGIPANAKCSKPINNTKAKKKKNISRSTALNVAKVLGVALLPAALMAGAQVYASRPRRINLRPGANNYPISRPPGEVGYRNTTPSPNAVPVPEIRTPPSRIRERWNPTDPTDRNISRTYRVKPRNKSRLSNIPDNDVSAAWSEYPRGDSITSLTPYSIRRLHTSK